jgi:hypothetical protein
MHGGKACSNYNSIKVLRFTRHFLLPVGVVWTSDVFDPGVPEDASPISDTEPPPLLKATQPQADQQGKDYR